MDLLTQTVKNAFEVDVFFGEVKILSVINASILFYPESAPIINNWGKDELEALSEYTAPIIVKMLKK